VLQCASQRVVVRCSVLQCDAVCCSVLQCVAVYQDKSCTLVLQAPRIIAIYVAFCSVCCNILECVAACCSVLQCVAVCCSVLQHVKTVAKRHILALGMK